MSIKTKKELNYYLKADLIALGRKKRSLLIRIIDPDYILKYQILYRKTEFYFNNRDNFFYKYSYYLYAFRLKKLSFKLGFSIPINRIGPGLAIPHIGPIIINQGTKIGNNCTIHVGVNIGTKAGFSDKAPIIGDNIYIGPGAKIFGNITIPNNCAIGANAVVNKSFQNENKAIAGVPAREIADINIKEINILATKILDLKIHYESFLGLAAKETSEKLKSFGY